MSPTLNFDFDISIDTWPGSPSHSDEPQRTKQAKSSCFCSSSHRQVPLVLLPLPHSAYAVLSRRLTGGERNKKGLCAQENGSLSHIVHASKQSRRQGGSHARRLRASEVCGVCFACSSFYKPPDLVSQPQTLSRAAQLHALSHHSQSCGRTTSPLPQSRDYGSHEGGLTKRGRRQGSGCGKASADTQDHTDTATGTGEGQKCGLRKMELCLSRRSI